MATSGRRSWLLLAAVFGALALPALASDPPSAAAATPVTLKFPFRPGAAWQVIEGYNGGTHKGYERYSFDFARMDGQQQGEDVLAAAGGRFAWDTRDSSGCLGIDHPDGTSTEYCHLTDIPSFADGQAIAQGQVIGKCGNKGAEWTVAHIHFTWYKDSGGGDWQTSRVGLPLDPIEGRHFPADDSIINQWGGTQDLYSTNGSSTGGNPQPQPSYTVGQGAAQPRAFQDAYTRLGGAARAGQPSGPAYWWGEGSRAVRAQDFTGGSLGSVTLVQDERRLSVSATAVPVLGLTGDTLARYRALGGPNSALGLPTAEEASAGRSPFGTSGFVTAFSDGRLYRIGHNVYALTALLDRYYRQQGGPTGSLGYPRSDAAPRPDGAVGGYFERKAFVLYPNGRVQDLTRQGSLPVVDR